MLKPGAKGLQMALSAARGVVVLPVRVSHGRAPTPNRLTLTRGSKAVEIVKLFREVRTGGAQETDGETDRKDGGARLMTFRLRAAI